MEEIIGRESEKVLLEEILQSGEAEFVAVYGRRRVGKTFLIKNYYRKNLVFELSGIHNATLEQQLQNFASALSAAMKTTVFITKPNSWLDAFAMLRKHLESKNKKVRQVIFFDEFPWIHTRRSGFMQAFEQFWNTWGAWQKNLIVVICGSAASWMIQKVINNRGGLYNRVTKRIRLLPFSIKETEAFLQFRKINLDRYQVLQIYMVMGGIPHYLKEIKVGESAAQAIDRVCFAKHGLLHDEFKDLYHSLFEEARNHIDIIKVLANKPGGLTRTEIIETTGLTSGGWTTGILDELTECGFITPYIPFKKTAKESIYRLTDEYSHFYIKFLEHVRAKGAGTWLRLSRETSWKSWSGYAFESLCLKHQLQIKKAIGIEDVYTETSAWRLKSKRNNKGAQIDLLFDRQDHCINICEMKFSVSEFTIDKAYAEELKRKLEVFFENTKTKKTLFLTMITTYGVKKNTYYTSLVQRETTMDALFV
jgi:AAA+ ATPase superfamily predicted ATPase